MNLHDVHRGIHKHKKRKRVGRGIGSRPRQDRGRGHKGQGALAGWIDASPIFEGGQMPLVRRIPKRGFNNRWAKTCRDRQRRRPGRASSRPATRSRPRRSRDTDLVKGRYDELKILGDGELTKKLKISAHRFSKSAAGEDREGRRRGDRAARQNAGRQGRSKKKPPSSKLPKQRTNRASRLESIQ